MLTNKNILETKQLTKQFGGLRALEKFDIAVREGSIHGLIGPNGSGKTTLFNLISGILPVTDGEIYFKGKNVTQANADTIMKLGMARTFQIPRILPMMTCLENVMVGMLPRTNMDLMRTYFCLPFTRSKVEEKLKRKAMELLDFVGLADIAERWASNLVGMEMRLLQIARALSSEPKLLLLDEPTAGMGENKKKHIEDILVQIRNEGVTIILVEHDISFVARISNIITCIDHGQKICEGSPNQVQNDSKVEEAYLGRG